MESASRSVCPVVDMAAEDSDGVERLPCRFSRRVVLHPQSPGGTQRSVQDRSPEMFMRGNRFAALAGGNTDTMPHKDVAVATQPAPVPLATWVDDESQRECPRRRLQLISQSTRVVGSNTVVHADFVEDELRVVADDRHPRVFGGEVPPNDNDELESLRDGDSVVTEFDSVEEDVFVPEVVARAPRGGSGRALACGSPWKKLFRRAVPTILPVTPEGGNCFCCCHVCSSAGLHAVES